MRVLMISRDESILEPNSVSAGRMIEYGNLCDELHIIVFSKRGFQNKKLSENVFVYPTNSFFKLFSILTAYRIGKKIIKKLKSDNLNLKSVVITTQDPFETGLVGYWLKKRFKIGLNIQLHGDFFGNPYWRAESFLNKIRLKIAKKVILNADSIRVVSERIKNSLSKIYNPEGEQVPCGAGLKSKIYVAPIFTDILKIQDTPPKFDLHQRYPDSNLILLWVGRMSKVKNLSFLLKAFKYVLEAFPKAILILVGDGSEVAKLKQEAKDLKIEATVKFKGEIPHPTSPFKKGGGEEGDLVSYYKTADIFVFPSLYEGWGRVVIEAAASGLPIVMTDVGCAGEVIKNGESGEVAAVNDLAAFVQSITKLGFNVDLRQKYKEAAFQSVKNLPDKSQIFELIKKSWELCVYQ